MFLYPVRSPQSTVYIFILTGLGTSLKQNGTGRKSAVALRLRDNCIFNAYELLLDIEPNCRAEMKPVALRFVLFLDQFVRERNLAAIDEVGWIIYLPRRKYVT